MIGNPKELAAALRCIINKCTPQPTSSLWGVHPIAIHSFHCHAHVDRLRLGFEPGNRCFEGRRAAWFEGGEAYLWFHYAAPCGGGHPSRIWDGGRSLDSRRLPNRAKPGIGRAGDELDRVLLSTDELANLGGSRRQRPLTLALRRGWLDQSLSTSGVPLGNQESGVVRWDFVGFGFFGGNKKNTPPQLTCEYCDYCVYCGPQNSADSQWFPFS